MKYIKKQVVVEARKLEYSVKSRDEIAKWCNGEVDEHHSGINIKTPEGIMYAQTGDYIIKGIKGEFYPCKPDIFEATYSPYSE